MRVLLTFETLGNVYSVAQCNGPENLDYQQHCVETLFTVFTRDCHLSQMNPISAFPSFFKFCFVFYLGLPCGHFTSGLPHQKPMCLSVSLFTHLDFITLIIFIEELKLQNFSLCSFLHLPVSF
jgi:hypothetical protein